MTNKKKARCSSSKLSERRSIMDGYYTSYGYMGLINGEYMLFATENEYYEYLTDG